jgi:hypothetical protein
MDGGLPFRWVTVEKGAERPFFLVICCRKSKSRDEKKPAHRAGFLMLAIV